MSRIFVLDPGHGGSDPGAVGPTGLRESEVALQIAQRLSRMLEPHGRVILTRETNVSVPLTERANIANRNKATIFYSIHLNAAANRTATGTEVLVRRDRNVSNLALGEITARNIVASTGLPARNANREGLVGFATLNRTNLSVLNTSTRPTVLTESAFISNPQEEAHLRNPAFIEMIVQGHFNAIAQFCNINISPNQPIAPQPQPKNYSLVYNYEFYRNRYEDLQKALGNNENEYLNHFRNHGMREGRQAIATFDAVSYGLANVDLRLAFGGNLKEYYYHFINHGHKENRQGLTDFTIFVNQIVTRDKINYSLVYDTNFYFDRFGDLRSAFSIDDTALLSHFINHGMQEGRQASKKFDVNIYRANYKDLQNAFGNNLKEYYMHFINHGHKEGRKANRKL